MRPSYSTCAMSMVLCLDLLLYPPITNSSLSVIMMQLGFCRGPGG